MKDILIVANFCRDFSENDNGRFMYICKELSKNNNVEIITSDFGHSSKKHKDPLLHTWPFKITFLHEPGYKKNISLKRFVSHYSWGREVGKYLSKRKKPDVVYCAVPSLTAPLTVAKYCEKESIKFIIDIQDLWPEAFKMAINIPIISDVMFFPFSVIANGIYKRADEIIAVSQTYVDRALGVNKKCKTGHTVFLGTKLETYDEGAKGEPALIKPEDEIWIGYCGSLSASYDIPNLIKAISMLNKKGYSYLKLIIMGDGANRKQYEECAQMCKESIVFTGKLTYERMCATLNQCDIAVNPIKHGSAASIINKHGDYAASGLPVVNTQESPEYRNLIKTYNMGLNCANENAEELSAKIEELIVDENKRLEMGRMSRKCAEEKFDRQFSYIEILNLF